MLLHQIIKKSVQATAGSYSNNTDKLLSGILMHILVQAVNDDTTFDFSIVNSKGITIKEYLRQTGEIEDEVYLPIKDVNTYSITNSSVTGETYNIILSIDES